MVMNGYLVPAALTGFFCAVFAIFVQSVSSMLDLEVVIAVSFVSGFLGSLFSKFCWKGEER